jgi:opacity protein-like surface antigen
VTILILLATSALSASVSFEPFVETEQGTIDILYHIYQNGESNDEFDYVEQGGQGNLYPFARYSVGATIAGRHRVWFTYQPLELVTSVKFEDDVEIGDETFDAGSSMELTYSFPFYRMTYTYDLLGKRKNAVLGVGLALQIRNASIVFRETSADTDPSLYVSQNVGLVPALAIYSEYRFPSGLVLSADIAGSYADSKFFNGADFDFSGSILDASLRMGYEVTEQFELFGTARFFGGTSEGTSEFSDSSWTVSDTPYTKNNIATLTFSVGAGWKR